MTAWQNIQMRHSELKMKKEKETLSAEELAEYRTVKEICDKQLEVNALIRSYGKTPQEKLEMDRLSDGVRFVWSSFNPDAMTVEEVDEWADYIRSRDLQQTAVDMTAEDSIAMIDAMRAVIYLYLYLVTKSHAMKCRLKGDIEYALRHEEACDLLYDQLPEQVRW